MYPESMPDNWRDVIRGWHIECAVSPLHDKDFDEDGTVKKPHYHVFLKFDGSKSFSQVRRIAGAVSGGMVEVVHNCRSALRYLCHLDDDDKAQYSWQDVESFCGIDLGRLTEDERMSIQQRVKMLAEMSLFIDQNNVTEYDEFETFCRESNWEWYTLLCTSGREHVRHKISSKRFRLEKMKGARGDL